MSAAYYVEVLNDAGEVQDRHGFDALPVSIGRGYGNDLVLDDAYVAARHAVIELSDSGEVVVRDLGSRNGLLQEGRRHVELAIDGDSSVRLGRTMLRIRSATYPVAEELLLDVIVPTRAGNKAPAYTEGWQGALAGLAIIILLSVSSVWISDTEQFSAIRYFMATALILGIVLIWCGGWAFAGRVFGSHASHNTTRFSRHLFIVACGLLAMDVWDIFSVTAAYAFSVESLTRYSEHVVVILSAAIIFFHLRTINRERSRRFALLCGLLVVLGSGLILMNNYQRYGRLSGDLYMTYILPPQVRLSPDQPVARFMEDAGNLKARVDEERLKPVKDRLMLIEDEESPAAEAYRQ